MRNGAPRAAPSTKESLRCSSRARGASCSPRSRPSPPDFAPTPAPPGCSPHTISTGLFPAALGAPAGPGELWERLDDAHGTAIAAGVVAVAGLAVPGAVAEALRRVGAAADELAAALDVEIRAVAGAAGALRPADNPWLRTHEGAG